MRGRRGWIRHWRPGHFVRPPAAAARVHVPIVDERAWLRYLDGYVGSGGSEWVGGETDSDDDYYFPSLPPPNIR